MVTKISDFLNTTFSTLTLNDAINNSVVYPGTIVHTTTGTPGSGIGAGIQFQVETSNNNNEMGMSLETLTTDVTLGSEDFDFVVKLMQNGAAAGERLRLNSAGQLTTLAGMVATSFTPNGSTIPTNGMYLPTTNTVGFATNTTERVRIDANGNVGVGTTTSNAKLTLQGGTVMSAGWNRSLALNATFPVVLFNSNGLKYSGIGTDFSVPSAGFLFWTNGSTEDISGTGSVAVRIGHDGNVSIGDSTPVSKLQVVTSNGAAPNNSAGTGSGAIRLRSAATAGVGVGPSIIFEGQTNNTTSNYGFAAIQGFKSSATAADYSGGLAFYTQNSGGSAAFDERMRIDGNGRVGIATTAPGSVLDVNGIASFRSAISSAGTATVSALVSNGAISTGSMSDAAYTRIVNPGGGAWSHGTPTVTGALAITLPVAATNTMIAITIKVYEYVTNESFELHVGGYPYSGNTWANNPFAYIVGNPSIDRRFNVRLGYTAGAKMIIYIGELADTWSYPQVFVTEVLCGYGGQSASYLSGWSIGAATAFENVTATIASTDIQVGYAVSTNTANSVVKRDGSGNFSAGAITGTAGVFSTSLYGATFNTAGTATVNALVSNGAVSGTTGAFSGAITLTSAAPQINLNNGTSNWIAWNINGVAAPTFTTRSAGTKLVLYPNVTVSSADFAIGIEGATMWHSVDLTSSQFKWYGGTTQAMLLSGAGALTTTSTATSTAFIPSGSTVPTNGMFLPAANNVGFSTNSGERVRIDATGNIGIGTTIPRELLHLNNPSAAGDTPRIKFTNTNTGGGVSDGGFVGISNQNQLDVWNNEASLVRIGTSGTERMRVDASGNVSIGTNLVGAASVGRISLTVNGTNGSLLALATGDTLRGYVFTDTANMSATCMGGTMTVQTAVAQPVIFATNSSERMRIDSVGNISIGTTGVFYAAGGRNVVSINGTSASMVAFGTGGTQRGYVHFDGTNLNMQSDSGALGLSTSTANPIVFYSNTLERMRIDSVGNVGIGTSTIQTGYKLQVEGDFAATTKSFVINHPTKPGMMLRYGSLESPYHGIRLTGEAEVIDGKCRVDLPDYIQGLCKQEGAQVQITNIKHGKTLWIDEIDVEENNFTVKTRGKGKYRFYWSFTAVRKDIEDMLVEFDKH